MNDEDYPFEDIIKFDEDSLTPIEIDTAEQIFKKIDKDNNGFIEIPDFKTAIECNFIIYYSTQIET